MSEQTRRFYDFGAFRLDTRNHRLTRGSETIPLTPKEFEVLFVLIENAGDVVAKNTLLDTVWKDAFVGDETLMRNISWLRKKLGATDATGASFIETVPKRGYRFAALVKTSDDAEVIIEEETLTRIVVEETTSISDSGFSIAEAEDRLELSSPQDEGLIAAAGNLNLKSQIPNSKSLWLALAVVALSIIGFVVYQNYFRAAQPKAVLLGRIAPFSGLTGREDMPAFSPDGKQLAFAWNGGAGEQSDIYVKIIGAGEPVRLTSGAENDIYPVFSPDGSHVAFVRAFPTRREVFLVPALGGAERRVCGLDAVSSSVSFSPDGRFLAVAETNFNRNGLTSVNLQTCERRALTAPPENAADLAPRFSPDGANLAFLRLTNDLTQAIFVVPIAGGAARQITFDKTEIRSLAWSADGAKIFFAAFRLNSQSSLWRVGLAGGEPEMLAAGGKNISNIAIAPTGGRMAFTEVVNDENIWQIATGAPAARLIASSRDEHSPHISPDGKRVVFVSDRAGSNDVWISDADGKNQRQLTESDGNAGSPRFSPDGKFVAYDSQINDTNDVFIVSSDGGTARRVTDAPPSRNMLPAWSADGRFVYFRSNRGGDWNIWKMAVNGVDGEAVQITRNGAFEAFAAPDGKEIYFSKGRGIAGLWRAGADGGDESPVPELAEAGFWRYWTIAGGGIYYVARTSDFPYRIEFYDFSTKQTRQIAAAEKSPLWVFSGLSASAGGSTILYAQRDQNSSNVMLAEIQRNSE